MLAGILMPGAVAAVAAMTVAVHDLAGLSLVSKRRRNAECKHREPERKKGRLCCS